MVLFCMFFLKDDESECRLFFWCSKGKILEKGISQEVFTVARLHKYCKYYKTIIKHITILNICIFKLLFSYLLLQWSYYKESLFFNDSYFKM